VSRRGRPIGATSWWRNPANIAAHHANVLLELWLAGIPAPEIRVLLLWLAGSPEHQALIEECWRGRGNQQRSTVPKPIKRKLCELAVAHVVQVHEDSLAATPQIKELLKRSKAAAAAKLRDRGWTDGEIAVWFNKLEISLRRGGKDFKTPDLTTVLGIVNRRAPATTLRRKARSRKLRRKIQAP
jgi:hypothetical protein